MSLFKKKEKADVDYVEVEHGPVFTFFSSLWTHILKIMSTNMLFVIFNIPSMIIAYIYTLIFMPRISPMLEVNNFVQYWVSQGVYGNASLGNELTAEDAAYQVYFFLVVFFVMAFVSTCLICIGPFQTGFHQIYRNLRRQEFVSVLEDFKTGVKKNWKQGTVAMLVSLAVTAIVLFALGFYMNMGGKAGWLLSTLLIVFLVFFAFVQNVVYQVIVSRELKLNLIYKNAFLFFILSFGPSMAMILLNIIVFIVIPFVLLMYTSYLTVGLYVFLYFFIVIGAMHYLNAYYTGSLLHRFMPGVKEDDSESEQAPISDDELTDD
ncbi:MAG: DUF624 domain-containing protein [Saccharofermentans sp.]|nr:DUF624 domain-containing protein [Saccharofermentans sp.]